MTSSCRNLIRLLRCILGSIEPFPSVFLPELREMFFNVFRLWQINDSLLIFTIKSSLWDARQSSNFTDVKNYAIEGEIFPMPAFSKIFFISIFIGALLISTNVVLPVDNVITLPKTGHRKPAIVFSHKLHATSYGAACAECHHKGKNIKCSSCHLRRDQGNIINLKGAFHQQCHDCHRKTSGPKACGRCHKKAGNK